MFIYKITHVYIVNSALNLRRRCDENANVSTGYKKLKRICWYTVLCPSSNKCLG